MDLASFFSESIEAARSHHERAKNTAPVPAVPAQAADPGNGQVTDNTSSSRCSRNSRPEMPWEKEASELVERMLADVPARASARASAHPVWAGERREQREQPAGSDTYSSRSLSLKRELREKTGTGPLPALPGAAQALPLPPTFDERAAFLEYECGLSRAAAEVQARLETHQAKPGQAPLAPAQSLPGVDGLALWCAGLARLDTAQPPCPGYRASEWPSTRARALAFLDQFGEQAEALGWTAVRLFGVHPEAGIVRVDACGALVLPVGGPVRAITATTIQSSHLTHREKPGQPAGVPWWKFGR